MKRTAIRISSIILFLATFQIAKGQEGNFFLKHYSNYLEGTDNYNWSIQQGNDRVMYFANTRGIISYDGEQWKLIKTPKTPLSLHHDTSTGNIYAGFSNEIGFFKSDTKGHLIYSTIVCTLKKFEEVTEIHATDDYIFFCNSSYILQITKKDHNPIQFIKAEKSFQGFFSFQNKFYVNLESNGIHELKGKSLWPLKYGKEITGGISFGTRITKSQMILGTTENDLYLFDGNTFKKFITEASPYFKETIITNAVLVSKHQLAVSTIAGGCVILSLRSGKTVAILNYQTGLPDNEVYAIGNDNNGGLWIAHEYGLTRMDNHIPFREYSSYPGLDGHILSVLNYKNSLYVSTSEGVYNLRPSTMASTKSYKTVIKTEIKEKKNPNNPFHALLKRRKDLSLNKKKNSEEETTIWRTKTVIKTLENTFEFKKTDGIQGKCRQIISYKDHLLVASTKGLYEIENNKGRPVIEEEYIHCIYPSKYKSGIYVSSEDKVLYLEEGKSGWVKKELFEHAAGVYSMEEDTSKNLWLGSHGKVILLKLNESVPEKKAVYYSLPEAPYENIQVKNISREIHFISSSGIFSHHSSGDSISRDPRFTQYEDQIFRYINQQKEFTWITSDSGWVRLETYSGQAQNFPIFSLLKNIQHLYQDEESNIWVVDESNRLFKLNSNHKNLPKPFQVHVREIKSTAGNQLSLQDLNLEYTNNSLKFFLAAPFFIGEDHIHYQYHLEGAMTEWSSWNRDHKIEFTYLPSGDYNLILRAKNVFGQITETSKFSFTILPPYWQTTWFFILEFLFFVSLLVVSINLNRNRQSDFFTKAITFLTLIVTVEFIVINVESVITVGDADPFIRFGLNVMLALLISPIEKILEVILSKRKRSLARLVLYLRKKHWPSLKVPTIF